MAIKRGFIKPIIYRPQTKTLLFVRHSFFYKLTMLLSSCNTAYEVQTDGLHPAAWDWVGGIPIDNREGPTGFELKMAIKLGFSKPIIYRPLTANPVVC